MKDFCCICKKYNLEYEGKYTSKCTECDYAFVLNYKADDLLLGKGFFYIYKYNQNINGKKIKQAYYLCNGTFDYCIKVFKLKVFL